jgi:YHS domain-containing protein
MKRLTIHFLALVVSTSFGLAACKKAETTVPEHAQAEAGEFEGREVVDNWRAKPGDVTICPITGKKFEVDASSPHFSYQGYKFVFCCAGECLEKVEANPGKYLDALVEEAGGPASDPDPSEGGAIDDS